ncbi:MAG: AAA family ATPase [Bacteroidota bacterium]
MEEFENRVDISHLSQSIEKIREEMAKVIVGQHRMIDQMIVALLANGHVLLEGVPGIAKTLTSKLLAKSFSVGFSRIQFTPDLMPSDIIGTSIFNQKTHEFEFRRGPVFSNIVLIDEINRAPAKTQAALFEVMEERQITADGRTSVLEAPFIVFATQNPIEQEGTYRLPEAQLDRFLFKIEIEYPSLQEEIKILTDFNGQTAANPVALVNPVISREELLAHQKTVKQIFIEEKLLTYIATLVQQSRNFNGLYLGASPRASLNIMNAAKAFAAIRGRDFVSPDDVQEAAYPVLRHRIILTPEKEMEGATANDIVKQLIEKVEVPR